MSLKVFVLLLLFVFLSHLSRVVVRALDLCLIVLDCSRVLLLLVFEQQVVGTQESLKLFELTLKLKASSKNINSLLAFEFQL